MVPTFDQIAAAAYHRWLRRGAEHGRDRDDWYAAEQELLLSLNYRVIARHALDGSGKVVLGRRAQPVCRFCERTSAAVEFGGPVPIVPDALGNTSLFSGAVCTECRGDVLDALEPHLLRFARTLVAGTGPRAAGSVRVPIAAFKSLVAMALLLLPESEVQYVEDAAEWVANPNHELDSESIGRLECRLSVMPNEAPGPWVAVARRADPDAPLPYLLFALGSGRTVFQAPLPLCVCDEDLDGTPIILPRACPVAPAGSAADPTGSIRAIGTAAPALHHETSLQLT